MEMLKTKEAAELLSVSQTTIKRWAAMFPNFFPKDRFGHYIFTGQEIGLLQSIKERIEHGETLDSIDLGATNNLSRQSRCKICAPCAHRISLWKSCYPASFILNTPLTRKPTKWSRFNCSGSVKNSRTCAR